MSIKRIGKHLLLNRWRVRRAFPSQALANIEKAIKASEAAHGGQIRFAVEGALDGAPLFRDQPARARPWGGERGPDRVVQLPHLTVDHHGVQALFAAEVLIHHRLAHLGVRGDLLDLHVALAPCMIGYGVIARRLAAIPG